MSRSASEGEKTYRSGLEALPTEIHHEIIKIAFPGRWFIGNNNYGKDEDYENQLAIANLTKVSKRLNRIYTRPLYTVFVQGSTNRSLYYFLRTLIASPTLAQFVRLIVVAPNISSPLDLPGRKWIRKEVMASSRLTMWFSRKEKNLIAEEASQGGWSSIVSLLLIIAKDMEKINISDLLLLSSYQLQRLTILFRRIKLLTPSRKLEKVLIGNSSDFRQSNTHQSEHALQYLTLGSMVKSHGITALTDLQSRLFDYLVLCHLTTHLTVLNLTECKAHGACLYEFIESLPGLETLRYEGDGGWQIPHGRRCPLAHLKATLTSLTYLVTGIHHEDSRPTLSSFSKFQKLKHIETMAFSLLARETTRLDGWAHSHFQQLVQMMPPSIETLCIKQIYIRRCIFGQVFQLLMNKSSCAPKLHIIVLEPIGYYDSQLLAVDEFEKELKLNMPRWVVRGLRERLNGVWQAIIFQVET